MKSRAKKRYPKWLIVAGKVALAIGIVIEFYWFAAMLAAMTPIY